MSAMGSMQKWLTVHLGGFAVLTPPRQSTSALHMLRHCKSFAQHRPGVQSLFRAHVLISGTWQMFPALTGTVAPVAPPAPPVSPAAPAAPVVSAYFTQR